MSLAITTPLLSTSTVTPAQVRADILSQPNRTRYSDAEVSHLVDRLFYWCGVFGFNPLLVAAQIAHETNRLRYTGDVPFGTHNFAGLGATGGVPGHRFPSIDAGVLATVAHHAVYRWGARSNWPAQLRQYAGEASDPRYDEALAKVTELGRFMVVLGDYRGTWAVPGTTYPESIVRVAGEILQHPRGDQPMDERPLMLQRLEAQFPLPYRVSHIPAGNPNRPGGPLVSGGSTWITVHETANLNPGANAEMHRQFTHNGGGKENVSFTYVVDDHEAIELLPRWEKSWQASDGAGGVGNSSESIEACVNADGDWGRTREHLARLIARLIITDPENSPDRIAQHNTWARDGKNCPSRLRANGGREWNLLLARVREVLTVVGYFGTAPAQPQSNGWFLHIGDGRYATYAYRLGFRGVVEGLAIARFPADPNSAALAHFGPPEEDEWVGIDGCSYQRTRKGVLKYTPGNAQPWDIIELDRDATLPERKVA